MKSDVFLERLLDDRALGSSSKPDVEALLADFLSRTSANEHPAEELNRPWPRTAVASRARCRRGGVGQKSASKA